MANYSTLKAAVADVVKTNGTRAITGANLQSVLLSIINSIGGGGYIFKGVATPSTDAGTPDENVFYIGGAGTYANFGTSVTVPVGSICVFKYNGSWAKEQIALFAGIDDVPTAGSDNLVKSGGVYNLVGTTISTGHPKINEYVTELYIASPDGKKIDGLYCYFLEYTAENGFTITLNKNSVSIAYIFRKKNLIAGNVYEMTILDSNYSDYRFFIVYAGNTTTYSASGLAWMLSDYVYNFRSWPVISNYISSKGVLAKSEVEALSLVVDTKQNKPTVCSNANANKHIIELYIESGYKDGLYISSIQFTSSTHRFTITYNGNTYAFVNKSTPVANEVYRFSNENITLYWVWSGLEDINVSGVNYRVNIDTTILYNWSAIYSYIENNQDIVIPKNWCSDNTCNEHIEEFYIEPSYFVTGMKLSTAVVRHNDMGLLIKDGSNNTIYVTSQTWPTLATSYPNIPYDELIFDIISNDKFIGYIKLKYTGTDYGVSGVSYALNQGIVTNIDNSPTIKKMYNNDKQLVLFGDSLISYPSLQSKIFRAYLHNALCMKVRDVGCGGCNMAYRTSDGSSFYDSFSFPKLVNAFVTGVYDANQQNPISGNDDYSAAMTALKEIDKTKKLIVICEYGNNDFTNSNVQLGDMMVADTQTFDIDDLDLTTCLGAMTYGIAKLFEYKPDILFGQYVSAYTMTDSKGMEDYVSPTKNMTRAEWFRKIAENARHIGVPSFDSMESSTGRNFFTINLSGFNTVDGTHANAFGMYLLGKSFEYMVNKIS